MDFITGLPILINQKSESYNSILVIVDRLTKIVYYKPVKVIINTPRLGKIIFNMVVWYHGLFDLIVTNGSLLFISNFWLLLCYFLEIKRYVFTACYLQTVKQIKYQNNTIETYLQAFDNFKQDDQVKLLPIVKFAYNNAKNVSTSYTFFKLNCGYHSWMSYENNINSCSKSKSANKLLIELRKLIIIY